MKLPRDCPAVRSRPPLRRYGYETTRQTGSHVRLLSRRLGVEHHITIPRYPVLKVGTLSAILADLAAYFEMDRESLAPELFES
ncbi:MAG: type II toxin-antitoxin system HicA family toxin [SAR202 cluster bacterium]|nr:type II toxin-antitoxin system HicA family toxin [SAR202 cluster bacterium]MBM3949799.1 type II toxin-antitoxin system HicA family toxin [SAR202 cluster bacterium]